MLHGAATYATATRLMICTSLYRKMISRSWFLAAESGSIAAVVMYIPTSKSHLRYVIYVTLPGCSICSYRLVALSTNDVEFYLIRCNGRQIATLLNPNGDISAFKNKMSDVVC